MFLKGGRHDAVVSLEPGEEFKKPVVVKAGPKLDGICQGDLSRNGWWDVMMVEGTQLLTGLANDNVKKWKWLRVNKDQMLPISAQMVPLCFRARNLFVLLKLMTRQKIVASM